MSTRRIIALKARQTGKIPNIQNIQVIGSDDHLARQRRARLTKIQNVRGMSEQRITRNASKARQQTAFLEIG